MSPAVVALMLAVGVGTWIYTKLPQRTGYGNSKDALKGAAIAGGITFVVVLTLGVTLL